MKNKNITCFLLSPALRITVDSLKAEKKILWSVFFYYDSRENWRAELYRLLFILFIYLFIRGGDFSQRKISRHSDGLDHVTLTPPYLHTYIHTLGI